ncbi:MAG: Eco57I restriction-modification methylase domain-containing protein, partial [Anaerovoracaceae bacterium]
NIRCGNSLIDEFEGVKLINDSELLGNNDERDGNQIMIGQDKYESYLRELFEAQDKLFYEEDHHKKDELKKRIRAIIDTIIYFSIGGNAEVKEKYDAVKEEASLPFFLWKLEFARIFKEKGGFDVVIGNPPYVQLQKDGGALGNLLAPMKYKVFERTGDIYCVFYEQGINLLADSGVLCYITSNKWLRAGYGKKTREFLSKQNPVALIDLGAGVFETATVDTNILVVRKEENNNSCWGLKLEGKDTSNLHFELEKQGTALSELTEDSWMITSPIIASIKRKIEAIGTPLKDWDIQINRGILTGYNEAFIIDEDTKDALIEKDPKSAEIIKPILRGKDIKRYSLNYKNLWLINPHNGIREKNIEPIDINDYPSIKAHLDQYIERLEKRSDKGVTPYNLRN